MNLVVEVKAELPALSDSSPESSPFPTPGRRQSQVEETSLFDQLLSIQSFGKFHYFKYKPAKNDFEFILQCTHCHLIGPYYLVLSHMALTHDIHVGSKLCQWCKKSDMNDHIVKDAVEVCYGKYLKNKNISCTKPPEIIGYFYTMIEHLAKKLGVCTERSATYVGKRPRKGHFQAVSYPQKLAVKICPTCKEMYLVGQKVHQDAWQWKLVPSFNSPHICQKIKH